VRIDGILHDKMVTPKQVQAALVSRIKVMADMDIAEKRRPQDGRISLALNGREYDFRVSTYPSVHGEKVVMRVLDKRGVQVNLNKLGIPASVMDDFENLVNRSYGIIGVTGPTGSGKSTTLASMLDQINGERAEHIVTIEDPIEYLHSHRKSIINQRELGEDTNSFQAALRSVLREDPDVILVGEMRDLETISLAITCAETGHLVMATLHTNNAAESVDRIVDVFPPSQQEQIRVQLSNNLVAILSQQLLPRAGQPGRVAAMEVMIATSAIRNLIRENKAHQMHSIIQTAASQGMQSMDQALRDLYRQGVIGHEVAMRRSHSPAELEKLIAGT